MKAITVNYKTLGKQEMQPFNLSIDIMLGEGWKMEPYVFGTNTEEKYLPPIHCELESLDEYMRLSRKFIPELIKMKGNPKTVYTNNDKQGWFVMDVTDKSGKKWKSIAGWTRTRCGLDPDGKPTFSASVCRPRAMGAGHSCVDHYFIEVTLQEFIDIEATLIKNAGILPNDNPDVIK